MKTRLTPLNIVSSVLLVGTAYVFLFDEAGKWRKVGLMPSIALFILSFITDLIFRRFLKDLKRIWIVELVFIIFVAVLILIIQAEK